MGAGGGPQTAELVVEFAEVERDDSLGPKVTWDAELCQMPEFKEIPDLDERIQTRVGMIDMSILSPQPFNRINPSYYRDAALYEFVKRLYRPARLVIKNVGQALADNVRLEIVVPRDAGIGIVDSAEIPEPPKRRKSRVDMPAFKGARAEFLRSPGEVTIDKNDDRFRVEIDCGSLQPGRRVWSEVFYIGKGESGEMPINGQIFSENLPQPKDFSLAVNVNVTETRMTVAELLVLFSQSNG
jgi:hypothetical protein